MYDMGFVILTWNSAQYVKACLDSITAFKKIKYSICVIDNGSKDATLDILHDYQMQIPGDMLHVVELPKNKGTTISRNIGLRHLKDECKYICVLDSDTVVSEEAMQKLMDVLEQSPTAGIVGPVLKRLDGSVQNSGRRIPNMTLKLLKVMPMKSLRQRGEQMEKLPEDERSALVLSSEDWHQGVVGIVASRLSERFSCPSFMIHLSGGAGKGSCRSYGGFNLFSALEACSDLLVGFGGHELAAGFTIEEKNIPAFRARMNRYVRAHTGENAPVSSVTIDVDLTHPSLVSLQEVDALSLLEPYGAGNDRPVFCLRGATLESVQSVGQNRHLKLRLQKGRVSFDGIFFSVTSEECALRAGMRVDAAFYLQINEFRAARSIQLQLIDLRPSLDPSGRESEALALCRELTGGGVLSPRDAARALPSRDQFVRAWRILQHEAGADGVSGPALPLLRRLSAEMVGAETFLRTAMCLQVFAERGLVTIAREGETLSLRLTAEGKKVELEDSPYLSALHGFLS